MRGAGGTKTVHLGFEVGTGSPVAIPLRHTAITGQTQEAGKTTTLEALIDRSGLRAITFITKRGEGSFKSARRIPPYFRDQTDWQYVASILEASRGERLKLERAFIIRASKGARTLADVQANVRALLADPKVRGMASDMYLCLDAYLDVVVPEIARVKWAQAVELQPGVNAMDLGALTIEMQHLVIRSTINWVLEREHGTVIVVPEAWKFIPQGRGTPVKLAAESLIRQGAAVGNYLWLDSQDLGGIEKAILRSVAVWLLGVQREANEIKRTLDNIPAGTSKPKAADIARLRLGEFFACWGEHVIKTYVQPAWMDEATARMVARDGRHAGGGPDLLDRKPREEAPEVCERHEAAEREVEELRSKLQASENAAKLYKGQADARERMLRDAEERAAAGNNLRAALAMFLPAGAGGGPAATIDEDALVARVLARVPTSGGGPITVTPPEKLRKDFQRQASERLLAAVAEMPAPAKRILKLLIALDKRVSQREAIDKLGVAYNGQQSNHFKTLQTAGLIDSTANGTKAAVRERIQADLGDYGATSDEVEAVYQNVLHELATEA